MKQFMGFMLLLYAGLANSATVSLAVPGTSDIWLAGMPNGSSASGNDLAPAQSPVLVNIDLGGANSISFSVVGQVSNGPCCALVGPDGANFVSHSAGAQNGISDVLAPHNSLVGVFLDENQPDFSSAPGFLNFKSSGTHFAEFQPELKQVFFIGDGIADIGLSQIFKVPLGATRLFLGTMDQYEWSNNIGSFNVQVTVVPLPPALWQFGSALAGLVGIGRRQKARKM